MSTEPRLARPVPPAHTTFSRKKWSLLFGVLAIVAVGGAILWGREHRQHEPLASNEDPHHGEESTSSEEAIRVTVIHPERGGLAKKSEQVGSVHPFEHADLYSKVSGYLKVQNVDIGSEIKKGDLLAEIDDPEVVKERDRAAAALTQSKAVVAQARARVTTAKADVKAAEAEVARSEALILSSESRMLYRQKQLKRYQDLFRRNASTQQIVDEYEDHYETTKAELQSARAAALSAKAQLDSMRAKVEQAEADLAAAESNVQVAVETLAKDQVLVDYTKIRSPYDGVITLRNFYVGDFIRSATEGGERPMLTAARSDKMRVVTYVPDLAVPYTDVGDKAVVTLDALPGMQFEGKVSRFSHSEEVQSRTMRTEIDLENPKGLLREGMYGVATIYLDLDTKSLTIPSASLVGKVERGKSSVYVVRDGHAREVPVQIGTDSGIRVEILKGLTPEDEVIVNKSVVQPDAPVTVDRGAKAPAA